MRVDSLKLRWETPHEWQVWAVFPVGEKQPANINIKHIKHVSLLRKYSNHDNLSTVAYSAEVQFYQKRRKHKGLFFLSHWLDIGVLQHNVKIDNETLF